jgi:hypothetical protein
MLVPPPAASDADSLAPSPQDPAPAPDTQDQAAAAASPDDGSAPSVGTAPSSADSLVLHPLLQTVADAFTPFLQPSRVDRLPPWEIARRFTLDGFDERALATDPPTPAEYDDFFQTSPAGRTLLDAFQRLRRGDARSVPSTLYAILSRRYLPYSFLNQALTYPVADRSPAGSPDRFGPDGPRRMLTLADYADQQPANSTEYQPPKTNWIGDAWQSIDSYFKPFAKAGIAAQEGFINGIDPNTGKPAVSAYDRANTLAHWVVGGIGPQTVGATAARAAEAVVPRLAETAERGEVTLGAGPTLRPVRAGEPPAATPAEAAAVPTEGSTAPSPSGSGETLAPATDREVPTRNKGEPESESAPPTDDVPAGSPGAGDGIGEWRSVNESMSPRARAYQTQITGQTGQAHVVNGVKFDGVGPEGLIDAKGPGYSKFLNQDGTWKPWIRKTAASDLVDQADRQTGAAQGRPVVWYVAEPDAAAAMRDLVESRGVTVIHRPPSQ